MYLADQLKQQIAEDNAEEWMPDQASMFADLLNSALGAVDWYEIADSLLDSVDEAAA